MSLQKKAIRAIIRRFLTATLGVGILAGGAYAVPARAEQDEALDEAVQDVPDEVFDGVVGAASDAGQEAAPESVDTEAGIAAVVDAGDLLCDLTAGAADVIEQDYTPSQEQIDEIVQSNAWKAQGALVMANVNTQVNVRSEASEDSEKVGLLYKDCGGYILEYTDTWTRISSGDLTGWVRNDFLSFGDEAQELAAQVGTMCATVTADTLRVRKSPSMEAGVYGMVEQGEVYELVLEPAPAADAADTGASAEDWVVIDYNGEDGYVSREYVDVDFHIDHGETMEAIREREAAAEAARAAERAAQREAERIQYYGVYAANASDVELLGALIWCEAGNQPYEGKVAVGACVMNRVRSAAYPNTIYDVIYASGQFTPAGSGAVDRRIAAGVDASCLQAAQDALNGYSNIGGATHFRRAGSKEGIVIGAHVFW